MLDGVLGGITDDPQSEVACDPRRSERLPYQNTEGEVGHVGPQSGLIRRVRQLRRDTESNRRPMIVFSDEPNLRRDHHIVFGMRRVAGDVENRRERRIFPVGHVQQSIPAVDLDLGSGSQPEVHADSRQMHEIPGQSVQRNLQLVQVIESCLDEDASVTNRRGVLGDQRPLLCERSRRREEDGNDGQKTSPGRSSQAVLMLPSHRQLNARSLLNLSMSDPKEAWWRLAGRLCVGRSLC